jgi:hypothetical protein
MQNKSSTDTYLEKREDFAVSLRQAKKVKMLQQRRHHF